MKLENKNLTYVQFSDDTGMDDMRMLNTVVAMVRGLSPSSLAPVYIAGDDLQTD